MEAEHSSGRRRLRNLAMSLFISTPFIIIIIQSNPIKQKAY